MPKISGFDVVGKDVFAKWPGSQLYYPGKVVDFDPENKICKVQFDSDGESEALEVLQKHVTTKANANMWRSRSASPARSPVRARRRSRSKSPSRARKITKSPSRRRSPARSQKANVRNRRQSPSVSPEKEPPVQQAVGEKTTEAVITSTEVQQKITKTESNVAAEEKSYEITKRVTRSVARMQEKEKTVESEPASIQQETETVAELGWRSQIEAILGLLISPPLLLALTFVCADKRQAFSFTKWPIIPSASEFFDWKCFILVGLWFDIQFLLTLLPIGELFKVDEAKSGKKLEYRLNGFFLLSLNVAGMCIAMYTKHAFKLAELVDENYLKICTSCIIVSFVASLVAMIIARWDKNIKDKSLSPYNFMNGLQLNPRWLKIDFKIASIKSGLTMWVMLNFCFLLTQYSSGTKNEINYPTLLLVVFQLIYISDTWMIEKITLKTREVVHQQYGFGFAFMSIAMLPFFYSIQTFYLSKMSPQLSPAQWAAFIAMQVIGLFIFHKSNVEKHEFRSDPRRAMKREVKVIFTADGKNLLADGWWGRLRHPNYLGDILVAISWSIPAGCTHILPWLYPILLVVLLVFRAADDEAYCAKKYGLSWVEYKARVKYVIFPYVY